MLIPSLAALDCEADSQGRNFAADIQNYSALRVCQCHYWTRLAVEEAAAPKPDYTGVVGRQGLDFVESIRGFPLNLAFLHNFSLNILPE